MKDLLKSVMTWAVIGMLGLIGTGLKFGLNWGNEVQASVSQLQTDVAALQDIKGLKDSVEQLTIEVKSMKREQLTVTGNARVAEFDCDFCISINTSSRAANYAGYKRARITNLSHPDTPSTTVDVMGTFRNSDANYVAQISRHVASMLNAQGQSIDIRIEPAE